MKSSILPRGCRVAHCVSAQKGLIVDGPETHGCHRLYRVALEGSTRAELWHERQIRRLGQKSQLKALGGNYEPPAGYPFFTVKGRARN